MNYFRQRSSLLVSIVFAMIMPGCTPRRANQNYPAAKTLDDPSKEINMPTDSSLRRAPAVASHLRHSFLRAKAEEELIQMGPAAEPAGLGEGSAVLLFSGFPPGKAVLNFPLKRIAIG